MFKLEREMTEVVRRWLLEQKLFVKTEFQTPWGICDLVGAEFREHQVQRRLSYRQFSTLGSPLRAAIILKIPEHKSGRSVSIQQLADKFRCDDTAHIEDAINCLEDRRFIIRTRAGGLQKVNGWYPLHRRVVAVELKLAKIEEVARQAVQHFAFATESYVGLPMPVAERLVLRSIVPILGRQFGIIGVGKDKCKVLRKPVIDAKSIEPAIQMYLTEKFWPDISQAMKH